MFSVESPEAFDEIPELGMGFHFGAIDSAIGRGREGIIVLNAELAITANDILDFWAFERWQWTQGREVAPGVVETMIMTPEPAPKSKIVPCDDVALFKEIFGRFIPNVDRHEVRTRLHASPPFRFCIKEPESLVRFSAFKNDRRIRPDGSVLPGSYVTSGRDAGLVPSGFAAVGRYALPNPLSAINRFDIEVAGGTPGLVGTVLPAFGQAGGGVEIELTQGAPAGSLKSYSIISEH